MSEQSPDFIVSELLSELKAENTRKDAQLRRLYKVLAIVVVAALTSVLITIGGFLWYLYQYDFVATTTETVTNTAEGVYAVVDSDGNIIGQDLTAEEIQKLMEEVTSSDGESYTNNNQN